MKKENNEENINELLGIEKENKEKDKSINIKEEKKNEDKKIIADKSDIIISANQNRVENNVKLLKVKENNIIINKEKKMDIYF